MKSNSTDRAGLKTFLHTSQDGKKNQPISKHELDTFADENGRFNLTTGGKANRKQRRRFEQFKKK